MSSVEHDELPRSLQAAEDHGELPRRIGHEHGGAAIRSSKGGFDDLPDLWALPERPNELPDDLRPPWRSGRSMAVRG
jgi:hypothetical protein